MPEIDLNGVTLFYREAGETGTPVVFSSSYLFDHSHYDAQIEALADSHRIFAYDHRDHGRSTTMDGSYDFEQIYGDAEAFVETVVGEPCHFVGLSTGGFVGLRLGIRRPELLRSLVVLGSTADREPFGKRVEFEAMLLVLGLLGPRPLEQRIAAKMFGRHYLQDETRAEERGRWIESLVSVDRAAARRFGRAILGRASVADQLSAITSPVLVIAGALDRAISPRRSRQTAEAIPGADFVLIADAGHLSTIERPQRVSELLRSFFVKVDG